MPSEPRIPRRPLLVLAAGACVLVAFCLTHVALDALALRAERGGASLWWNEQHLRLFRAEGHARRDRPRVLFTGSSEAREAFVDSALRERLAGWETIQHAWVWSTLEELVVFLEYLERAHGDAALPEVLVVGVTTRYVADVREFESPFFDAIDRYSPRYRVDRDAEPPRLLEKGLAASLRARMRYLGKQGNRYRSACKAAVVALLPRLADDAGWRTRLVTNSFHHLADWEVERKRDFYRTGEGFDPRLDIVLRNAARMHAWDPAADRARVEAGFARLREILARHGTRLFLVNLPELSTNRAGYDPARYDLYLELVRQASGDAELLDLRAFLADEEYQDHQHANRAGAVRLSRRTAEFLRPLLGP